MSESIYGDGAGAEPGGPPPGEPSAPPPGEPLSAPPPEIPGEGPDGGFKSAFDTEVPDAKSSAQVLVMGKKIDTGLITKTVALYVIAPALRSAASPRAAPSQLPPIIPPLPSLTPASASRQGGGARHLGHRGRLLRTLRRTVRSVAHFPPAQKPAALTAPAPLFPNARCSLHFRVWAQVMAARWSAPARPQPAA